MKVQEYRQNLQESVLEKQAILDKIGYQSYLATMMPKD
jgi:5-(carboxyamino)imidazole ribonucleotide mutase